jgi:hypothetical protein
MSNSSILILRIQTKTEEDFIKFQINLQKLYETNEKILKNDFEVSSSSVTLI